MRDLAATCAALFFLIVEGGAVLIEEPAEIGGRDIARRAGAHGKGRQPDQES